MGININDILSYHNLGKLGFHDSMHAYGVTDKDIRVWLPHVKGNQYWTNFVMVNNDIIVQSSILKKRYKNFIWEPAIVITRDKKHGNFPNYLGSYRPVWRNADGSITIHAKDTLSIAVGTPPADNSTDRWVSGFAATAEEAQKKADSYIKKAKEILVA